MSSPLINHTRRAIDGVLLARSELRQLPKPLPAYLELARLHLANALEALEAQQAEEGRAKRAAPGRI